ncbi:MAG: type II toxin-antitoxin system RelE/ParE family toxin [Bacteroidetes bacterium]|nr:type II toxin-antitoxin system RelE/ParE family toxin [Bacteroidota bacterium]
MDKFKVKMLEGAIKFLKDEIDVEVREKFYYIIKYVQLANNKEFFKKLNDNIWEFRVRYNGMFYRLFAFWDKSDKNNTLVVATHGIIKKTDKIPPKEIDKAEKLMNQYFSEKE